MTTDWTVARRGRVAGLALAAAVAACATPYQDSGGMMSRIMGGFSLAQLDTNVFRISFAGNGFTSRGEAEEMTLLRSAQAALDNGFTHFVIVDAASRVDVSETTMPRQATTTGTVYGGGPSATLHATTTYSGGETLRTSRPSTTNLIVCFRGRPDGVSMAYDATMTFNSLAARFGVPVRQPRLPVPPAPRQQ